MAPVTPHALVRGLIAEAARLGYGGEMKMGGRGGRGAGPGGGWAGLVGFVALTLAPPGAVAGQTRCWLDKGAVVVPASFGDIAGDFLLDLARPVSALHDTRANEDGLTGDTATAPLRLAGIALGRVTLPIVDLDPETRRFDTTINGVLGADVARGRILTLDFRHGRCRLGLSPRRTRGSDGLPTVRALVSDGVKTRSGRFALGTAQVPTTLAKARLSRPATPGAPIRLRALEVGGRLFEQTPAQVGAPAEGLAGTLGTAVLAHGRLVIDGGRGVAKVVFVAAPTSGQ